MKDLKRIGKEECKIKSVENESLVQKNIWMCIKAKTKRLKVKYKKPKLIINPTIKLIIKIV